MIDLEWAVGPLSEEVLVRWVNACDFLCHDDIVILKFDNEVSKYFIFNGCDVQALPQLPELLDDPIANVRDGSEVHNEAGHIINLGVEKPMKPKLSPACSFFVLVY